MLLITIDSNTVDNMNGNIDNTNIGNTTIDASNTNGNTTTTDENYDTVYLNDNRWSARLNNANSVFNLSIRKATIDYGDTANCAIKKEINQMIDKCV